MNRTETRVNISTSASKFHKSLRENTNKFGESVNVNAKADNITDMGSCFRLLDSEIFKAIINLIGSCPKCQKRSLEIISNPAQKKERTFAWRTICDWKNLFMQVKK